MKIGIFIPNWIGDAAMATPALRALRRHFGAGAELIGILRPYVADVLAGNPWLDEQIFYHPKSKNPAERTWPVLGQLRQRRLDTVVLLTNSLRAAALAWASGARERVGYVRYGRGPLLTHKLYFPRHGRKYRPTPALDAYLQLAYAMGCERESPHIELATLSADEAAADMVWKKWNLPAGDRVVVLNSGGAYGAAKLWPGEYFAQLARKLATAGRGPGRRADFDRSEQSLHPPQPPTGHHRQRPTLFRRGVWCACRFLVRSDGRTMDAHPLCARNLLATRGAVRALRAAVVPTGPSRLHAITERRASVRDGDCATRTE